jgi:hypothetical protein
MTDSVQVSEPTIQPERQETIKPSPVLLDTKSTIEAAVGPVTWLSDQEGFVACPGQHLHSQPGGLRDCKLYLDPVPALTCFHASCREVVEAKNRELRRALAGDVDLHAKPRRLTADEKQRLAGLRRKEQTRLRAANARGQILRSWAWPYAEILAQSPVQPNADEAGHWRSLLGLFNDGDVLWIGSLYNSGKPEHACSFRTKEQWLGEPMAPAQFTCPAVFKPGSIARSNDNIVARRFLVVESDELTKDQVGAVFRWLKDQVKLNLRAIVDTAGKSLHGWFDYPAQDVVDELKLVLPQLGCDPKLFTASQPVRLPGAPRNAKYQRLVWLAEGGAR